MFRSIIFSLVLLIITVNAQFGYNPYAYQGNFQVGYPQMAYNTNYYSPYYPHSQAPSPAQQQAPAHQAEAPSTIFSMGSPSFAKASDLFALPKMA